jgi:hypothetical protein
MATTPHDSTGTLVVFGGTTFTVTSFTLNFSDVSGNTDRIDVSHIGQSTGSTILTVKRPLVGSATGETGKEVSFDYIGTTQLTGGTTGTFTITGGTSLTGAATVVSSSLTLAVNDVVRGSVTIRVA